MIVAVDFGTTNTVAVARWGHRPPHPVAVDGTPTMPSAVLLGDDGTLVTGQDAIRIGRTAANRLEPRPKSRLDEDAILLGDTEISVVDAVAAVLARVCREAARHAPISHLVLTHPADWGAVRLGRLTSAATGLAPQLSLVPEPVAAIAGDGPAPGTARAVLDFGGGTCDAAVIRASGAGHEVLACGGLPDLGGDDLDERLLDLVLDSAPADVAAGLRSPTSDLTVLRARHRLRQDARAAKELLSRHDVARVAVPGVAEPTVVRRADFEARVAGDLARAATLLTDVLRRAATPVDEVVLVGGTSRIPALGDLLRARAPAPVTTARDPETVVARGALAVTTPGERTTPHPVQQAGGDAPRRSTSRHDGAPPGDTKPVRDGRPHPGRHTAGPTSGTATEPPGGAPTRRAVVAATVVAAIGVVAVLITVLVTWRGAPADQRAAPPTGTAAPRGTAVTGPPALPAHTVPGGQPGQLHAESLDRVLTLRVGGITAQPATDGYRWVRADVTVTMLSGHHDMTDPTPMLLVDDRGQRILPDRSRPACPPDLAPLSVGGTRQECQEFLVPDATPVAGVMYDDFATTKVNRGGLVLAAPLPATGPTEPPGVAGTIGGPATRTDFATVRVDEVVETPSAHLSADSQPMNGTRYVIVRVTVTASARDFRAEDFSTFRLLDDRGLLLPEERLTPARLVNCPEPHRIAKGDTASACLVRTANLRTPVAGVVHTAPDRWYSWLG